MVLRALVVTRRLLLQLFLAALAFGAGCTSMQNTPQQDYVWEMGHHCNTSDMQMTRVLADGSYTVQGASNVINLKPYFECMQEQFRLHPYREWVDRR